MNQEIKIRFQAPDGEVFTVPAKLGASVMETAVLNNVPGIEAECGGACICATCHVYDRNGSGEPGEEENEMLEAAAAERRPESRLSCQITVSPELDGAVFEIPEEQ